ncbi:putative Ig domain-containing protein [Luteolibacter sp. GHJ8]|uniref:Ig domain-containing protein n=1 Tax=Luteolibacter rhizosphaerae TaxID=2989719 RepID=A0ABT3FXL8_9BACT|nr:LamG-like jellyroll fold domain-containing protein [Luteolibacter rhizosphaerae]MCW1912303.1 putative Ig domain-containing protein [Luteolibacter rhizosphaerae]
MKALFSLLTTAVVLTVPVQAQQALSHGPKHRYRFDNTSGALTAGTQILDSMGTAHGVIRGSGASGNGSGVRLAGGASASAAYIDLPNASMSGSAEMYPGLAEASYEVWVTVHSNRNWSRILDFGNNSIDEVADVGGSFNGADYLTVTANVGTANDIMLERGGQFLTGGGNQFITGATTVGTRMHLVTTYDTTSSAWKLYKNGVQIASVPTLLGPSTIDDLNVWLGRSNWAADSNADATYDEFRSYDYALSAQQVLGNYQAGPETITAGNLAPVFTANPFSKPAATLGVAYSGSIAGDASDPNAGDTLSFSKTGGPAWLTVSGSGALSGTPPGGSAASNAFTVRVTDQGGFFAEATMNITVTTSLPSGWTATDIGSPGVAGGSSESAGTFTLSGSGSDISGTADGMHYAWQTLAGDGEIRARVTSQTNTHAQAKAGVMIRGSNISTAVNALMAVTPGSGFQFQRRTTASGSTNSVAGPTLNAVPNNWVRLTRSGTLITGYVSANGTAWTQVGTATIAMPASVSIGLAVSSHNNAVLGTATFDNVSITPYPVPWLTADIGSPGLQGSAEFFGGAHTVKGAGSFGGLSDGFRYVYQTLGANGSIVARVSTLNNTGSNARVGVMMRDTLDAGSRMAALTVTGSGGWRWQRRTLMGGTVTTTNSSTGTAPNLWVRLARSGSTVTASRSTDGSTWTTIGSVSVTMGTNYYVGLAVASGSTSVLNTSVMDNVAVALTPPPVGSQADSDGDGMPDAWEALYGTTTSLAADADADGDGQTNRDEYVAGTNPLGGTDVTRLKVVSVSPAMLEFNGKAGRSYTLERMVGGLGSEWQEVQAIGPVSADGAVQITDPAAPTSRGIYRLQIMHP